LAAKAGVDAKFVGAVERGKENPSLNTLQRLASALAVDVATLVTEDDPTLTDLFALRQAVAARAKKLDAEQLRVVLRILDAVRF
jgi:transcriptional regulator with XRE-family HTH domain